VAELFFMNGPHRGKVFVLEGGVTYMGRSRHNHIQINEASVSRHHLKILQKLGKFLIKDLGSTNGTLLAGQRIIPGKEYEAKAGEPIELGDIRFAFGEAVSDNGLERSSSVDRAEELDETTHLPAIDTTRDTADNIEFFSNVSKALMESFNLNEIFEKTLYYLFHLLKRIDRGFIIILDDKTDRILDVVSRHRENIDDSTSFSKTVVEQVIRERKPVVMSDIRQVGDENLSESIKMMRVKSIMCAPLISRSKIRGVLYVDSVNKPRGFRKADLSVFTALSGPVAVAIENALLYSKLEKLVEERTRDLRHTEDKLKGSEARFKAIFDNMSSGAMVYRSLNHGQDFVVIDLNRSAQIIEKVEKDELLGTKVSSMSPGFKEIRLIDMLRRVLERDDPEHHSVTLVDQQGETTGWREYFIFRLPSGEIVSVFDDITPKKKAEEEQKVLQRQLFFSQKMETIGTFAGGVAHNFRNILQAISGNAEFLEMMTPENRGVKDSARSIHDSVKKGVDLVNSLLYFSRKGGEYVLVDTDLFEVIMQVHEIVSRIFEKNIDIQLDVQRDLIVKGNPSLLSQVFMNLFTNARDAMPKGGKLVVEAKKVGQRVMVTVTDTGHGIDKETLGKIFDPFFTLKDVGKGTGLGLSTTHGIIEQHGGSISAFSEPGKGTTFRVTFPASAPEKAEKESPPKPIPSGKGQKILIVDDERPALEALTNLTRHLGYNTMSVDKPVEALRYYKEWSPDVVLMDRVMPEMDGSVCIEKIVEMDPKANIVIISGYNDSGPDGIDEKTKGLVKGYLTKPFKAHELSDVISQALGDRTRH
jgi:signal transduction histidine kinase/pSer/pThr/pTyr-binding forkhead associated (FHA) protein/ActR/RegA family two-component response regulator